MSPTSKQGNGSLTLASVNVNEATIRRALNNIAVHGWATGSKNITVGAHFAEDLFSFHLQVGNTGSFPQ